MRANGILCRKYARITNPILQDEFIMYYEGEEEEMW